MGDLSWFYTLPQPIQELLAGAGGDFLGGLAAEITVRLFDHVNASIRKRFEPEPKQVALNRATARALAVTVRFFTDDTVQMKHYLDLFEQWAESETVIMELSKLIAPRSGSKLNVKKIQKEFKVQGFDPKHLGIINFEKFIGFFIIEFPDACDEQEELIGEINTKLTRRIAEGLNELVDIEKRKLVLQKRSTEALENIDKKLPVAKLDSASLRQEYLVSVRTKYRSFILSGLAPVARLLGASTEFRLADVYVELPLRPGNIPQVEFERHEADQPPWEVSKPRSKSEQWVYVPRTKKEGVSGIESPDLPSSEGISHFEQIEQKRDFGETESTRSVKIWDAVARHRRIIISGIMGSGKSTTARYLTLALAREVEPAPRFAEKFLLPIFIRLGKFGRGVEDNPNYRLVDHLCSQFERDDFSEFLRDEISIGHCLIIMDGLDEVPNIVEVLDKIKNFIAGYPKNRVVMTSRPNAIRYVSPGLEFEPFTLPSLEYEQKEKLVGHYCKEQAVETFFNILTGRPKLKELDSNPLMLTFLALIFRQSGTLPKSVIEVLEAITQTFIEYWPVHQERFDEDEFDPQTLREILMPVAYRTIKSGAFIGEDEIQNMLVNSFMETERWGKSRARKQSRKWIDFIANQIGILLDSGPDDSGNRVFEFVHAILAQYLAACYLADRWDGGDETFVKRHVHLKDHSFEWEQIIPLFIAHKGFPARKKSATKALQEAVLNLKSPWEKDLWRDHLLAGECLGQNVPVVGIQNDIIIKLVALLTVQHGELRTRALNVLKDLRGTKYARLAVEEIQNKLKERWPWYVEVTFAEAQMKLGETEQSQKLLETLRETARRRGWENDAAYIIQLLLELEDSRKETIEWLINTAKKYEGRGLEIFIDSSWKDTEVVATDESFGRVCVGKYLKKQELNTFATRLVNVLTDEEQKERSQWVRFQLNEPPADEMSRLALYGHGERVRRLAAEWLTDHGGYDAGIRVLTELATQDGGNLLAGMALMHHQEWERAIHGAQTTLTREVNIDDELAAIALLVEIWQRAGTEAGDKAVIGAALTSIELFLSGELSEQQSYEVTEFLLDGPAEVKVVGKKALQALAASIQHLYRYEAAIALGKNGEVDNAYDALLDIAERWGAPALDRAKAIITLIDLPYVDRFNQDEIEVYQLAGRIVNEVSDKYRVVTKFLEGGIDLPEEYESSLDPDYRPRINRDTWEERFQAARDALCSEVENWLKTRPEEEQTHPSAQAVMGYILAERANQTDVAISMLEKAIKHPDASAQMLLRVGEKLLKLNAKKAGLEALNKVPYQCADVDHGRLQVAQRLNSGGEQDSALEIARKLAKSTLEFWMRREIALLLCEAGYKDEAKELLFSGLALEVPKRNDWLAKADNFEYREIVHALSSSILKRDPKFAFAWVVKAQILRSSAEYNDAIEAVKTALQIDDRYPYAWAEKGNILKDQNQHSEALENLNRATILDPTYKWAWTLKADTHRVRGHEDSKHYDDALDSSKKALAIDERYASAWGIMGETLTSTDRHIEGLNALERATYLDPEYTWAWASKAEKHRLIGQYEEALAAIKQALGNNRQYVWAWGVKGEVLENMGRREEALVALEQATKLHSDYTWAWTWKAETLRRLGEYDAALTNVEEAFKINDSYLLAWRVRSEILDNLDRYDKVLETVEEALESQEVAKQFSAISALAVVGDDKAIEPLLRALKSNESSIREAAILILGNLGGSRATDAIIERLSKDEAAEVRFRAAWALYQLPSSNAKTKDALMDALGDDKDEVRRAAAGALAKFTDEEVLVKLSELINAADEEAAKGAANGLSFSESEKAEELLRRAINKRPNMAYFYGRLGVFLRRQRRLTEALDCHEKAIRLSSKTDFYLDLLYSSRAATYHAMREYPLAVSDLQQAIELDPTSEGLWAALGEARFEMGQYEKALNLWWRAYSLSDGGAYELACLGIGLWKAGNQKEALRLWRQAVRREPSFAGDWEKVWQEHTWEGKTLKVAREIVLALEL